MGPTARDEEMNSWP